MIEQHIKKVLILGSGALKIGEAGEFDYSGSQALNNYGDADMVISLLESGPVVAEVLLHHGVAEQRDMFV